MSTTDAARHHPDTMLDTQQAAELLGLRPQTLHDWRCRCKGPSYHRLGTRAVRYRVADLRAWADARRVESER